MNNRLHQPQRRSIRWRGYDYSQNGAYFVSISVHRRVRRKNVFGRIENGAMTLNVYGRIVTEEWLRTAHIRPNVVLDEWVVMPNHFHGILMIVDDGTKVRAHCNAPVRQGLHRAPQSLSSIVSGFKGSVTRRINTYRVAQNLPLAEVWHRNYFERVVRNESELDDTRHYIAQNPLSWESDEHHPVAVS